MGDRGESGDRAVRSCSNSERDGRNEALDVSVTKPIKEFNDGVDMDFLSDSVPGSLGGLLGQGVSGT